MRLPYSLAAATFIAGALAASPACADVVVGAPIDVLGNLSPTDFTGNSYASAAYKDWGSEPSVAVNLLNPKQIVVASYGYATSSTTTGAELFYSGNGGQSWASSFTIPAPAAGAYIPSNWVFGFDSSGTLHGAVLGNCGTSCNVYVGSSTSPNGAGWTWSGGGAPINITGSVADQPWMSISGNKVYVAYDNYAAGGPAVRMAASGNGGASFTVDNSVTNGAPTNSTNPGTRIASDSAGTVYAIYAVASSTGTDGVQNVTYYLNRSRDGGQSWDFSASSAAGGLAIASGKSTQFDAFGSQASNTWFAGVNNLRGSITAIASNASGSHIYVLYGVQDASGTDRIYLQEFHPSGATLAASPAIAVSVPGQRAALPSITVLANGTVVIEYETYDAKGNAVAVHLAYSTDNGASIASDIAEYSFTPLSVLAATGSSTADREFGDYLTLVSVGNSFYGSFAGLGNTNTGSINTTSLISPFLFTGSVSVPEPAGWLLFATGLGALGLVRRRRRPAA